VSLAGLLDVVSGDPAFARALAAPTVSTLDLSGPAGLRPFLIAGLVRQGRTVLAVTATGREAEDLVAALGALVDGDRVALYPSWETLPHERLSPRADTVGRRLAVLRRLRHPNHDDPATGPVDVVVAPVRSILQPQVPGLGDLEPVALTAGRTSPAVWTPPSAASSTSPTPASSWSRSAASSRAGRHPRRLPADGGAPGPRRVVGRHGRGGPVVQGRRPAQPRDGGARLWAPPCRELLLTPEVRARAGELARTHPELADICTRIADGHPVEGMEALAPVLVDELRLLVDELPAAHLRRGVRPEKVRTRAHDLVRTSQEFLEASWATAAVGGAAPVDLGAAAYRTLVDVREHAGGLGLPWWSLSPFTADEDLDDETVVLAAQPPPAYRGEVERAIGDLRDWTRDGWRVVVTTEGHGPGQRLHELLKDAEVPARLDEGGTEPGVVHLTTGCLGTGFRSDLLRTVLLTESDLTGTRGTGSKDVSKRMPSRRKNAVDPVQLESGDTVVHEQHGVARYVEMVQRTVQGATREYLILEFAPEQEGPARRPRLRADRPARARHQVRRRRGARASTSSAAATGPSARAAPRRRSRRSPPASSSSTARGWPPRSRLRPGHARGSASSRTPSRTSRRPTSSRRSTR
jgi:transcription-repair coupling factor (superfamily II helicase)